MTRIWWREFGDKNFVAENSVMNKLEWSIYGEYVVRILTENEWLREAFARIFKSGWDLLLHSKNIRTYLKYTKRSEQSISFTQCN